MPEQQPLQRALGVLGPLEARIMEVLWTGRVREPFVVRDVLAHMSDLAYTTVMTTLNRLAAKGLLDIERKGRQRPSEYRVRWNPGEFLAECSRNATEEFVQLYGEAALAAFAARLEALSPDQMARLRALGRR